ncbi:MAG: hypothetical protein HQL43_02120 [Alphaproteobacteria bacterium]|nr:hypothetical protein [Alphaproteobacteria bacterium]
MFEHDPLHQAAKERYGFASWPGGKFRSAAGELTPRRVLFAAQPERVKGMAFLVRKAVPGERNSYTDYYSLGSDEERISISIHEFSSDEDAREGLVNILSHCMAIALPRCADKGLTVGDIGFCGLDDTVSSVFFVRQNVLVRVESVGRKRISVVEAAKEVDAQLQDHMSRMF